MKNNYDKRGCKDDIPFLTRLLNEEAKNMEVPEMKQGSEANFFYSSGTDSPDEKTVKYKIKKDVNVMNYKTMTAAAAVIVTLIAAAGIGLLTREVPADVTTEDVDIKFTVSTQSSSGKAAATTSAETSVSVQITETLISEAPMTVQNETTAAESVYTQPEEIIIDESPEEEPQIDDGTAMTIAGMTEAYKDIINSKINYKYNDTDIVNMINYTCYDIDKNGVPELILIYGMHEASMQFACYTYNENGIQIICDGDGGHHSSFGYDVNTGDFVLISGHMGYGESIWYDIENGVLTEKKHINTDYADSEEHDAFMAEQGIAYLYGADYNAVLDYTMIYSYDTGGFAYEEYDGADYRFFDRFLN